MTAAFKNELQKQKLMRELGQCLSSALQEMHGKKMAFILLVAEMNEAGQCDYISNGSREDCIKWMQETI